MPRILQTGVYESEDRLAQSDLKDFLRKIFAAWDMDIERMLPVFDSAEISERQISFPLEWYRTERSFAERNAEYQRLIPSMAKKAIAECLERNQIGPEAIDHIVFLSTTGIMTPSPEATLINDMGFRMDVKRTPVWGLGCLAGAVGLSRGCELARAYPDQAVLVVAAEVCSLAFQGSDRTKKNVIATALFSDGAGAALIVGDEHPLAARPGLQHLHSQSAIYPDTQEVMGWEVLDTGLSVLLHKSIPALVQRELRGDLNRILEKAEMCESDIDFVLAHPGGAKVLDAMEEVLGLNQGSLTFSRDTLRRFGNMSSPTILYVLHRFLQGDARPGKKGILAALGPGFSSELIACQMR